MKKLIPFILIFIFFPLVAIADTKTCVCTYTTYSDQSGNHRVKGTFLLTFVIDRNKNVAYIIGDQGSAEVMLVTSKMGGITFIEMTATGNVMTTTIDLKGDSVHSRNTVINGKIIPTQYYGKCKFK